MTNSRIRRKPIYPKWDHTNVWEVSGRRSIKREDTFIVAITLRHSSDVGGESLSGSGSGSIITWNDFKNMVDGKIKGIFSTDLHNIYIHTGYSEHVKDGLNTQYSIIRTGNTICSHITPGLLKALSRISNTDAKRFTKKSQNPEQFERKSEYSQGGKREEGRGYIAWRSRVF